ncbi:MAG: GxxExxY protein [Spirochaetia bacterium]|nr:GxxExxY protein [Spirochaetia bacterium]
MNLREPRALRDWIDCGNGLTSEVIRAAIEVHRTLGPGLLESVYELSLVLELLSSDVRVERQVEIPVSYKGTELGTSFRADLIVDSRLILEIKAVDSLRPIHIAQIMTYQRILKFHRGLILNFNTPLLKDGIKRVSVFPPEHPGSSEVK